jgi:serine/threonine-protein kinase
MGEVWLARQRGAAGFARDVAIKRLLPQAMEQRDVVAMFIEEAQITGRLRHPNVVNVIELGAAESGELYLVLEYVDGTGLHKLLRDPESRPSPVAALTIARDIALALHAAHTLTDDEGKDLGLVHRDVTPSNVMIDRHGHVKLMDFGIAKVRAKSNQTEAGIVKGKIAYLAPEQLRGEVDPRSDLFALGLVTWEVIAGKQARSGSTDAVMMAKVALDAIPSIADHSKDLPQKVIDVVDRMCALDPNARYEDGEKLAEALLDAIGAFSIPNPLETARAELGKLVKAIVKKEVESGGANTAASRTVDAGRPMALTLHSLVVQQDGLTLSRPLSDDMIKAIAPPDAMPTGTSRTQMRRRRRSAALPMAAAVGALALLGVGVVMKNRGGRAEAQPPQPEHNARASVVPPVVTPPVQTPPVTQTPPPAVTNPAAADAGVATNAATNAANTNSRSTGRNPRNNDRGAHVSNSTGPADNTPATLGISVRPWGNVRIDSGSQQEAPVRVSLPPGPHTVVVTNPDRQVSRTIRITLAPGERNIQTIDLTHE